MKKTKFTESQIVKAIMEAGNVRLVTVITHELSNDPQTLYNRKKKCAGKDGDYLRRLKELEKENRKLKHMHPALALDNKMLKEVLIKKVIKSASCREIVAYLKAAQKVSVRIA